MAINKIDRGWGFEIVIQNTATLDVGAVRLYWNRKKQSTIVDFSINNNQKWNKMLKTFEKYGKGKITIPCDEKKLDVITTYFAN